MLLFGLFILLVGTVGIIVTLILAVIALFKKNSKNWKRSGISLASTIVAVISLILVQETFLYPPNPKTEQLVLSAYREAPIGGIWLGLYNDETWELGKASVDISSIGVYQLSGDTLTLIAAEGTTVFGNKQTSFLMKPSFLEEIENSGIRYLEIQLNKLEKNRL